MTKAQHYARERIGHALATIEELVPQEQKRESRARRKGLEQAYDLLRCHAPKVGMTVPQQSTFYRPGNYLEIAQAVRAQLQEGQGGDAA
jgi:hypothetical protein